MNNHSYRKKRGHKPTGILVHAAKNSGFSSVSEMLSVGGPDSLDLNKAAKPADVSSKNSDSDEVRQVYNCLFSFGKFVFHFNDSFERIYNHCYWNHC